MLLRILAGQGKRTIANNARRNASFMNQSSHGHGDYYRPNSAQWLQTGQQYPTRWKNCVHGDPATGVNLDKPEHYQRVSLWRPFQ